jgi:hypothetical protein
MEKARTHVFSLASPRPSRLFGFICPPLSRRHVDALSPPSSLPKFLVTTTRGSSPGVRGWLSIFALNDKGDFARDETEERIETPTSGGKANAVDLLSKQDGEGVWIVLTDDDEATFGEGGPGNGAVRVLEYNGLGTGGVKEVAEWPTEHKDDIRGQVTPSGWISTFFPK